MLLAFRVANHGSIRDPQELTMYRSRRLSRTHQAVAPNTEWTRPRVSTVAAIYGANGAGKSHIIDAMATAKHYIATSFRNPIGTKDGPERNPFRLEAKYAIEPTEFEFEFVSNDGNEFQYGFAVNDQQVVSEWLYKYRTANRTVLFERGLSDDGTMKYGPSFKGSKKTIETIMQPGTLFLSASSALPDNPLQQALDWLTDGYGVYAADGYATEHPIVAAELRDRTDFSQKMLDFMSRTSVGVAAIDSIKIEVSQERVEAIRSAVESIPDIQPEIIERFIESQGYEIQLSHNGPEGPVGLPWELESDGTKALVSFASIALRAIEDGGVLVVDEIDTSLHPVLVRELVALFQSTQSNPKQAQILFTTHDVTLLTDAGGDESPLYRDQIWFVEKDTVGVSHVIALTDYKKTPRKEENIFRGYLAGRYGGIPISTAREAWSVRDLERQQ